MFGIRPDEYRAKQRPPAIRSECALIVIDAQNDFFAPGGKFFPENSYYAQCVRAIIKPIKELVDFAVKLNMPIFYSMTQYYPNYIDQVRIGRSRELGALVRGTWGAAIIDELTPPKGERVFVFETHHYNKFHNTNLELMLHRMAIRTLIITGATTNICCESTARAARERDFYPIIVRDCVATFNEEWQELSLQILDRFFGSVLTSIELLEDLV